MKKKIFSLLLTAILLLAQTGVYSAPVKNGQHNNGAILESNKLTKAAHDAYEKRDFLKAGEGYEKAYKLTGIKLYLNNSTVAYISYAYDLANQKDYDKALEYSNKVLSMNPSDKNAKELLADIYYSKGADYFYTGDTKKANIELDNALKASTGKEQTDKIQDALNRVAEAETRGSRPIPKYENSSGDDVPNTINALESKLYGTPNQTLPVAERLNKLEKDAFGQTYTNDSMIVRVDRLKRSLIPNYISPNSQQGYASSSINSENYIDDIMNQSKGQVSIFGKMPITVYIDDCNVKPYKKSYRKAVLDAMKEWEKASDKKIKFEEISEPAKSDIKIVWTENFEDFPWQPVLKTEDLSKEKERMKYRKANMLVEIGSVAGLLAGGLLGVPVIGSVAGIGSSAVSPYLQYKGMNNDRLSPDIKIAVKPTEGLPEDQADLRIKQIAMHQLGHAIGIFGHSQNPNDIMFSNFTVTELSPRDISTIKEIYKNSGVPKKP